MADDGVGLNISMDEDGVDLHKSMGDELVELYRSADDGGADSDKSMDDEPVELYRSMDADFMKVTGARKFSYADLVSATNNFSEKEKLGMGGFGAVYKGFLEECNSYVAVKRVSSDSKQGIKEYAYEVKIISQLRHRNIVQLIGWCHERKELLLVYEFMANGSLDSHLFKENRLLTWEMRYKIARGLASGLLYLHEEWEQYVVHRDIKASNVMLDSNFNPKIGDFGLARLGDHGKGLENTTLAGTIGYVAPEYATTGRASKESDIYSFGIVALEIACGRKIIDRKAIREDQMNLTEWVWDLYGEGKLLDAADPRLKGEIDKQQVEYLMTVGLWCAHPDAKSRPTIEKAIDVLKFVAPRPNLPSKMPMATYLVPFSMSSRGTELVESKKRPPSIVEGGFGALYRGFLRELNFALRNRGKGKKENTNDFEMGSGPRMFSYKDLVRATNNFSDVLGEGNFGKVYRGFLEELSSLIAVKIISGRSTIVMDEYATQFNNIISLLRHRNLVQLLGLCHRKRKLFLVYEFMPNGSLDSHFSGKGRVLTWEMRYKIAHDLASGLLYLHEEWEHCVVHGDIKSSNVMLDSDYNAKLGDFCLAKFMDAGKALETGDACWGYIAPECFMTGKASKETDVYGLGIVALEIACGKRPINWKVNEEQSHMVQWVWDLYGKGRVLEAADPRLNGDFDEQQVKCLMVIGLWCAHPNPNFRPSMRQAMQVLNSDAPLPPLPPFMPPFVWPVLPTSMSDTEWEESLTLSSAGDI